MFEHYNISMEDLVVIERVHDFCLERGKTRGRFTLIRNIVHSLSGLDLTRQRRSMDAITQIMMEYCSGVFRRRSLTSSNMSNLLVLDFARGNMRETFSCEENKSVGYACVLNLLLKLAWQKLQKQCFTRFR